MYTTSHYHHHNHNCDDQCLRTPLVITMVMIVIITLCITVIRDISYTRLGTEWICSHVEPLPQAQNIVQTSW